MGLLGRRWSLRKARAKITFNLGGHSTEFRGSLSLQPFALKRLYDVLDTVYARDSHTQYQWRGADGSSQLPHFTDKET